MELSADASIKPGRWRLHNSRVSIVEMHVIELNRLLPKRRRKTIPSGR